MDKRKLQTKEVKRAISLEEFTTKYYKKVGNKTLPVPLREVLYGSHQYEWFAVPDRPGYVNLISKFLDDCMEFEEFREFKDYEKLTEDQILMRVEGRVSHEEHVRSWKFLALCYRIFKRKIYNLLVDKGIVEKYEDIDPLRAYYEGILSTPNYNNYLSVPEQKEGLTTFCVIYLTIIHNFIDVFGISLVRAIPNLEGRLNSLLNKDIIINGEISERVLHIMSSDEMHIITEMDSPLGVPKDLKSMNLVMQILRELEEDYSPPVMTMMSYHVREELISGFLTKLVTDDCNPRNNTLHQIFVLMRQGIGDKVVREFMSTPLEKKSVVRSGLEGLLIEWWKHYQAQDILSQTILLTAIGEVKREIELQGWGVEMDIDGLVSPSNYRVTFLNNENNEINFNKALRLYSSKTSYKAKEPPHLNYNKLGIQNNRVRILDVRVHP